MRRFTLVSALFALLVVPAIAAADTRVQVAGSGMRIYGGPGGAIIEHFGDDSRNGTRIRQIGLGDPTIRKEGSSPSCVENFAFNDIVCDYIPTGITVLGSGAVEEFVFGGSNQGCAASQAMPIAGFLGDGADVVRASIACVGDTSGINRIHPRFDTMRGEDGNDQLTGGRLADTFEGGRGRDTLVGGAGDDTLLGQSNDDVMEGGSGNDVFADEDGGADVFFDDLMDGGSGVDSVRYVRFDPVTLTLDGLANDGESAERDNLRDIENLTAGSGADRIVGSAAANVIDAGFGNDDVTGGEGADTLVGGSGGDFITSRDSSTRDVVSCGEGIDSVVADLADSLPTRTDTAQISGDGCERVERFAADDGPPARIVTRTITIAADGRLTVRLACPRRAKVDCRGKVRLFAAKRALASARYRAQKGRGTGPVALRLSRAQARKARKRGVLTALTRERGASEKGPRSAFATLRIRGA